MRRNDFGDTLWGRFQIGVQLYYAGANIKCTLWDGAIPNHHKLRNKRNGSYGGPLLFVLTIWGEMPLWDGRISSWFPGTELELIEDI